MCYVIEKIEIWALFLKVSLYYLTIFLSDP